MGISCQQNVHWAATNQLPCRGLVQATTWQLIGYGECVPQVAMHKSGN